MARLGILCATVAVLLQLDLSTACAASVTPPNAFILDFTHNGVVPEALIDNGPRAEELAQSMTHFFETELSKFNKNRRCFRLLERKNEDQLRDIRASEARKLGRDPEAIIKEKPPPSGNLVFRGQVDGTPSSLRVTVSLTNIWSQEIIQINDEAFTDMRVNSDSLASTMKKLAEKFCPKPPRSVWRDFTFLFSMGLAVGGGYVALDQNNYFNSGLKDLRDMPTVTRAEQIAFNQRRHDLERHQTLRNLGGGAAIVFASLGTWRYITCARAAKPRGIGAFSGTERPPVSWRLQASFRRVVVGLSLSL